MSDPATRSRTAANPPGHTSTHPDPARPAETSVRPPEDQLRAEQWARIEQEDRDNEAAHWHRLHNINAKGGSA